MPLVRALVSRLSRAPAVAQEELGAGLAAALRGFASSGSLVDETAALRVSAVWRSVGLISGTISALPLQTYRRRETGREPIRRGSEAWLWLRPNPEKGRTAFWNRILQDLLLQGNAFLYGERREVQGPGLIRVWRISPGRVTVARAKDGLRYYRIRSSDPGGPETIERPYVDGGSVVHITGEAEDEHGIGVSVLTAHRESIGLSLAADSYAATVFERGSPAGGYLTSSQELTPAQATELSREWERVHRGQSRTHRVAVLGSGTKFERANLSPEDAQLLATRSFQVVDVARIFGVPPHLVGDVERSTSWGTGIEEQNRQFVTFTLQKWIIRLEQALSDEFLGESPDVYARFELGGLLRSTAEIRAALYASGRQNGWLTANEIRELEELPPIRGGDSLLIPANQVAGPSGPPRPTAP